MLVLTSGPRSVQHAGLVRKGGRPEEEEERRHRRRARRLLRRGVVKPQSRCEHFVLKNARDVVQFAETCQPRSWSKAWAHSNMLSIAVRADVSHLSSGWLNASA